MDKNDNGTAKPTESEIEEVISVVSAKIETETLDAVNYVALCTARDALRWAIGENDYNAFAVAIKNERAK